MPVPKLIRPGDDCPDCGHLLYPHCAHRPWWKCGWVRCAKCRAYGTHKAWVTGRVPPTPASPDQET